MSAISSRRRVAAAVATALLAGTLTAWITRPAASADPAVGLTSRATTTVTTPPPDDPAPPTPPAGSSGPPPARGTPLLGRRLPTPQPSGGSPAPTSVRIEQFGIRMNVIPEGVAKDGEMALAPNPADIGWYRFGARPGDPSGATVLAAHVDAPGYGIGPLAQLGQLSRGDIVTVASGRQTRRYAVQSVDHTKKTALDLDALFSRTGSPRLHLVTCGGRFEPKKRHYDENVVVVATPLR